MKVKVAQSYLTLCDPMDYIYSPWNSPDQNTGVGSLFLLQGIFPTQGLKPGLPHCKRILYQLGHKGSPRILEWVAYPFSSGSSRPRNRTGVTCFAGRFLYQLSYQGSPFCTWAWLNDLIDGCFLINLRKKDVKKKGQAPPKKSNLY